VRRLFGEKSDECLLNMRLSPLWGYIGVSLAVAGAGLCVFAIIALALVAGRQGP